MGAAASHNEVSYMHARAGFKQKRPEEERERVRARGTNKRLCGRRESRSRLQAAAAASSAVARTKELDCCLESGQRIRDVLTFFYPIIVNALIIVGTEDLFAHC